MDYSLINSGDINRDFGRDVDSLVRIRDTAKMDLSKARMALLSLGVKTAKDGVLNHLPGLDIAKFARCENQEFVWEATLKDGSVIRQFEGGRQYHYGHIDQSKLKLFRWISNFNDATENQEKRVIITLDFETGLFEFLNGYVPQDVRAELINGFPNPFSPKLIMRMVKRTSTSLSYPDGNVDEVSYYNRFLIGWENLKDTPEGKRVLCIEPNGFVHLWHGE